MMATAAAKTLCVAVALSAATTLTATSAAALAQNTAPPQTSASQTSVSATHTQVPRVAIEDSAENPALAVLDGAGSLPFAVAVRVTAGDAVVLERSRLDDRLAAISQRPAPIWLSIPAPQRADDVDPWRDTLRQLLARHQAAITVLEVLVGDQDPAIAGFAIRLASTEARTFGDRIRVAVGGERMANDQGRLEVYTRDLAPYVDLLAVPPVDADRAATWLTRVDPSASLILATPPRPSTAVAEDARDRTRRVVDVVLDTAGSGASLVSLGEGAAPLSSALRALVPLAVLLSEDVAALDDVGAALTLTSGSPAVSPTIRHRLLFDNRTFGTYLVYWGNASRQPLEISLRLATDGTPVVYDLIDGRERQAGAISQDSTSHVTRLTAPLTGGPMLIDFNRGASAVYGERSGVTAARGLSVDEIIARHRVQQRLQERLVRDYVARARMEQHFRPNAADPGYDVVTENRYFVAGAAVEWEELSFSVNGAKWGSDRPPFPLLQPEKVLSLPLQLRFGEDYRYRLDGTDRINGTDCYVVRFEPTRSDGAFYRGTVWIDQRTFARIRVQALQSGLPAPVVSNEETQEYVPPIVVDGQPVHILTGLTAHQIILIAGRNLLVEKSITFEDIRVNDPDFERMRTEARGGERIMFADTDRGVRNLVKQGGERVVSDRTTQGVKAVAMGVTVDPSYAFPLPIAGINIIDFNFHGPNTQLALLFGGVLAAGNIQRPKFAGTPLDASVDFFGIAAPSSDRLYDARGSRDAERVLTWPMSTGLNLGWQYTPFQKITGQYLFRFDAFVRDRTTSDTFVVPSSTVTHGVGASWEYRRGGYSLVVTGTQYHRSSWQRWGLPDTAGALPDRSADQTYAKFGASLSRDFFFNVFHKIHLNGSWFSGRDLDRFAKYQFGLFDDTRIHGVPSSGVRFADIAMARGAYSLNIFEQYRVDFFLEEAWGRDRTVDPRWRPITGLGVAVNFRAPKSTILRADVGKSLLPAPYSMVGSYNLQILILKPLK